jgi:hypothetical protein
MDIIKTKLNGLVSEDFLNTINSMLSLINAQDLKRPPSLSEIIDWSVSMASAGVDRSGITISSLGSLLKDSSDQQKAFNALWKSKNQ